MFPSFSSFSYKYFFLLIVCVIGLDNSCSTTKFVPKQNYLLNDVKIHSDIRNLKKVDLKSHVQQFSNHKMFGFFKIFLFIYNLSSRDSIFFINHFFRKIGEAPVIFDPSLVQKTEIELKRCLVNKGFLNSEVLSEINLFNKKADVIYHIQGNCSYRIKDYTVNIDDSLMSESIQKKIKGELSNLHSSFIKNGMLFDRNLLDRERERMALLLQNRGYFSFNKENLVYYADSVGSDVYLKMKLKTDSPSSFKKFYYDSIFVYSNYELLKYSKGDDYQRKDSISQNGYSIFYQKKNPLLRTRTILNHCFIVPQKPYSLFSENLTYQSFSMLNILNNVHIQFVEKERNDSSLLDCYILMFPAKGQTVSLSVEGTNTSGDFGLASTIQYTHRNLFSGSETFNFKLKGACEITENLLNPYRELEAKIAMLLPDFIFIPNKKYLFFLQKKVETAFLFSYGNQAYPDYNHTLFSGSINFRFSGEKNKSNVYHNFDLLNVSYALYPRKKKIFENDSISDSKFLYTDRFVVSSVYSYINDFCDLLNNHYFNFAVESAGNTLNFLTFFLKKKKINFITHSKFPLAQYIKMDVNYSKKKALKETFSLVWHLAGGIIIPSGNLNLLPLEKVYYSGGANSVRAWKFRELGPGACILSNDTSIYKHSGNIKLDANLEYRIKCFWKLELASFLDAGNIWTILANQNQKNGNFLLKNFYKEIAIGYGVGARLNFDYFLIRLDFAEKVYDPAKGKNGWLIFHPNFDDHFAWHLSIGYPF